MTTDRIPPEEMAFELERMVYSKKVWLDGHDKGRSKRPDHEIAQKRREMMVLAQAAAAYRKKAEGG